MTYPQYAPQQYPGYPPVPQPPAGAQYSAPAAAYPPPAQPPYPPQSAPPAGQGITPPPPTLRDGGGSGGNVSPKMRHLLGRTVVVIPIGINEQAKNEETGEIKPEARFDLLVCDGGPLQYGDNQSRDFSKRRPNTHEIDTPCLFRGATDMGYGFVQVVRDALAAGEPGRAGVVEQGTKGNRPYLITKCTTTNEGNDRPDGQQRFDLAMRIFGQYWQSKHGGAVFPNPEPRTLIAPPPPAGAAPAQVNYGQPYGAPAAPAPQGYPQQAYGPATGQPYTAPQAYGYAAPQYAQTGTVPTPYGSVPAGQVHPEYAHAATAGAAAPAQPSAFTAAAAPEPQPPAAQLPPPVEAWLASLPVEQREISRAAYIAQQGGAPTAAPAPAGPGI